MSRKAASRSFSDPGLALILAINVSDIGVSLVFSGHSWPGILLQAALEKPVPLAQVCREARSFALGARFAQDSEGR
jgi:hypothetical protein